MIWLEILGGAMVLGAIAAGSQARYGFMFRLNLASAFVWSAVAIDASLWGLLGLQLGIAALAARGLWRLA